MLLQKLEQSIMISEIRQSILHLDFSQLCHSYKYHSCIFSREAESLEKDHCARFSEATFCELTFASPIPKFLFWSPNAQHLKQNVPAFGDRVTKVKVKSHGWTLVQHMTTVLLEREIRTQIQGRSRKVPKKTVIYKPKRHLRRNTICQHLAWSQTSSLQKCEIINACHVSHHICGICSGNHGKLIHHPSGPRSRKAETKFS